MKNFNCMYGDAHPGDAVAVRSKVGRTIGWLCALHFKNHEKALANNGYHFRTLEELEARGELNGTETTSGEGATSMDSPSSQQQRQPGNDHSGGHQTATELAPERNLPSRTGRRSHGGETDRPATVGGRRDRDTDTPQTPQELETWAPGRSPDAGRASDRTPTTQAGGSLDWPAWTQGAGYLSLTQTQREILQAPFDDAEITIRYDGVIYAPWRRYWSRMVEAFAPLVPAVIPIDNPRFQGTEIIVGVVMVCGGVYIGKAWGSHRLEGANDRMAVGDRIESAISDAISKIGKRLDMGAQLWDDQWRDWWKSQYAEQYTIRGRSSWRRKAIVSADPRDDEMPEFNEWERNTNES